MALTPGTAAAELAALLADGAASVHCRACGVTLAADLAPQHAAGSAHLARAAGGEQGVFVLETRLRRPREVGGEVRTIRPKLRRPARVERAVAGTKEASIPPECLQQMERRIALLEQEVDLQNRLRAIADKGRSGRQEEEVFKSSDEESDGEELSDNLIKSFIKNDATKPKGSEKEYFSEWMASSSSVTSEGRPTSSSSSSKERMDVVDQDLVAEQEVQWREQEVERLERLLEEHKRKHVVHMKNDEEQPKPEGQLGAGEAVAEQLGRRGEQGSPGRGPTPPPEDGGAVEEQRALLATIARRHQEEQLSLALIRRMELGTGEEQAAAAPSHLTLGTGEVEERRLWHQAGWTKVEAVPRVKRVSEPSPSLSLVAERERRMEEWVEGNRRREEQELARRERENWAGRKVSVVSSLGAVLGGGGREQGVEDVPVPRQGRSRSEVRCRCALHTCSSPSHQPTGRGGAAEEAGGGRGEEVQQEGKEQVGHVFCRVKCPNLEEKKYHFILSQGSSQQSWD